MVGYMGGSGCGSLVTTETSATPIHAGEDDAQVRDKIYAIEGIEHTALTDLEREREREREREL